MGWGWLVVMLAMVSKWLMCSRPSECGNMEPEKDKSSCLCRGRGGKVTCISRPASLETGALGSVCRHLCVERNTFNTPIIPEGTAVTWVSLRVWTRSLAFSLLSLKASFRNSEKL